MMTSLLPKKTSFQKRCAHDQFWTFAIKWYKDHCLHSLTFDLIAVKYYGCRKAKKYIKENPNIMDCRNSRPFINKRRQEEVQWDRAKHSEGESCLLQQFLLWSHLRVGQGQPGPAHWRRTWNRSILVFSRLGTEQRTVLLGGVS